VLGHVFNVLGRPLDVGEKDLPLMERWPIHRKPPDFEDLEPRMQVEVVSLDGELFSGEATFVLARTVEGDIGILANHAPLLAELAPYDVKIHPPAAMRISPSRAGSCR